MIAPNIADLRNETPWLFGEGDIPLELAYGLISSSVWWHTHSSGMPIRAPKFAERIESSFHGWELKFGANKFLIEKAIKRCSHKISTFLMREEPLDKANIDKLISELKMQLRGSVSNYDDDEYDSYYPINGDDLMFGSHSIDVNNAINYIIRRAGLKLLLCY